MNWETEDESSMAAHASLPTPSDTPYRTPSGTSFTSRRSSRQKSASPAPSSSPPPPLPQGETYSRRDSKDVSNDESVSVLDPRRFTPTLQANLVSEILNLRRDQEEKIKVIEGLESSLHASRAESETLATTLSTDGKETRSLRRQLALLEGGTSSALGELARERDEAVDSVADIKKRLETAQKKIRSQEEEASRAHELWLRDKESWSDEKRQFERKVHVAEGRLKAVLEEFSVYQSAHQQVHQLHDGEADDQSRDTGAGHGSDTASVRSMSMTNSIRFSMLNGPNGYGASKLNGISLADELDLDGTDDEPQTDHDGRESSLSMFRKRNRSRDSLISTTHNRNKSIDRLTRPLSVTRGTLLANQSILEKLEGKIVEDDETLNTQKPEYVDIGIQYSPSHSPDLKAVTDLEVVTRETQLKQLSEGHELEIEANQRRKRVHPNTALVLEPSRISEQMVSSGSQTLDEPLSPPRTPESPRHAAPSLARYAIDVEMTSSSTQTDPLPALQETRKMPLLIPSISIHPPTSRPATPLEPLLPQHFKDVGCQVSLQWSVPCRSASVQTEEIRVDQRINLLPKHLQPSSISSTPPSPELSSQEYFTPVPDGVPPRNPRRIKSKQSVGEPPSSPPLPVRQIPRAPVQGETYDAYPGNNDDGPLAKDQGSIPRPQRVSSLFAGFDNVSSDEGDDFADADVSDSDFRTALSAPKPKKSLTKIGKRTTVPPNSVPEGIEPSDDAQTRPAKGAARQGGKYDSNGVFTLPDGPALPAQKLSVWPITRQMDKPLPSVSTAKQGTMRRAALISNGIAAHQVRPRSPSLPEGVAVPPPFPIPTRASSRKPPFSVSAPGDGNRSPTRDSWSNRRRGIRGPYRVNSIRKVRSAAAIPGNAHSYHRRGSRSPPPLSASTEAPESPRLPPMPNNDITSPYLAHQGQGANGFISHKKQPSNNTANTTGSSGQGNTVVDAIAQTMVGEWMFKYVRRRKSFGVPDPAIDGDVANGARHKRWVWLSPYERAVMWSSKQPTTGSALMGKSGRKLTIQSVLDVKDDNPPPKGTNVFNRSILILTPARALKFTATTSERHYVWLTALSFLAHSIHDIPELMAPAPNVPRGIPEFELPPQVMARLRKNPIRDSIRVAKSKNSVISAPTPTAVHWDSQQTGAGEYSLKTDSSTRQVASTTGDRSVRDAGSTYSGSNDTGVDFPTVPRHGERGHASSHGRKRSNTGPRVPPGPPPLSFRGFSDRGPPTTSGGSISTGGWSGGGGAGGSASGFMGNGYHHHAPASSSAEISVGTNGSSDHYNGSQRSSSAMGVANTNYTSGMSTSTRSSINRTSDQSGRPGTVVDNIVDTVGTVRMEAFISPFHTTRFDDYPDEADEMGMHAPFGKAPLHTRSTREGKKRVRNRDSYYNYKFGRASVEAEDWFGGNKTAGEEDFGLVRERADDPFRGF